MSVWTSLLEMKSSGGKKDCKEEMRYAAFWTKLLFFDDTKDFGSPHYKSSTGCILGCASIVCDVLQLGSSPIRL